MFSGQFCRAGDTKRFKSHKQLPTGKLPWSFDGGFKMKSEDLLLDTWLDWQINSLSWLSSWMNFDERFVQVAEREVKELCAKLKESDGRQ